MTIEKPQNSSTPTSAARTRDPRSRPMPSPMTPGTARTEVATAPRPRAHADLAHQDDDRDQVQDVQPEGDDQRQDEGSGWPGTDRARPGRPRVSAPMRDRDAEDGARRTQALLDLGIRLGGQGRVDVPRLERPAVQRPEDALEGRRGGEQRDRVGDGTGGRARRARRGSPGSARAGGRAHRTARRSAARGARTTRPWRLKTRPISVSDRPRDSASRTVTGMSSPVGSQRRPDRTRNRRRAVRASRAVMTAQPRAGRRTGRAGRPRAGGIVGRPARSSRIPLAEGLELGLEGGQPVRREAHHDVAGARDVAPCERPRRTARPASSRSAR